MEVAEASFSEIISPPGTQFVIPVWQRLYSWGQKECNDLWEDLGHLYQRTQEGSPAEHFLGPIVLKTIEEKVGRSTKRLVIDGKQRLTTLLVVCAKSTLFCIWFVQESLERWKLRHRDVA